MYTEEDSKKFTTYADNLERIAANSLADACKYLNEIGSAELAKFKKWAEEHHDACFQFIEDYEKGFIGVKSSHIFWN